MDFDIIRGDLADKIKGLRIQNGYTQDYVREKLDISIGMYQKYEQGITAPSLEVIYKISEFYSIPLDELLDIRTKQHNDFEFQTYADALRLLFTMGDSIEKMSFKNSNIVILSVFADWKKMRNLYLQKTIDKSTYDFYCSSLYENFSSVKYKKLNAISIMQIIAPQMHSGLENYEPFSTQLVIEILNHSPEHKRHFNSHIDSFSSLRRTNTSLIHAAYDKIKTYICEGFEIFRERVITIDVNTDPGVPFDF